MYRAFILPERYWMWMGSAADIICSGHGPADGLQEERQQMLRINQLKLKVGHSEEQLKKKLVRELKIRPEELQKFEIRRQSIDARKKPELYYVYSIDVQVKKEKEVLKKHPKNVQKTQDVYYQMPKLEGETPKKRPVVVGSGPAGLFCAWILALAGCRPILLERGACVEERQRDVEEFWKSGILNPMSNVQFGEGGAGTFSDGKLNTLVKDTSGRNRFCVGNLCKIRGTAGDFIRTEAPHRNGYSDPGGKKYAACDLWSRRRSTVSQSGDGYCS